LRQAIIDGDTGAMPEVLAAIADADSLGYSLRRAAEYAQAAERSLDGLADNPHVAALRGLARYTVSRDRCPPRPAPRRSRPSSFPRAAPTAGCRRSPAGSWRAAARSSAPCR